MARTFHVPTWVVMISAVLLFSCSMFVASAWAVDDSLTSGNSELTLETAASESDGMWVLKSHSTKKDTSVSSVTNKGKYGSSKVTHTHTTKLNGSITYADTCTIPPSVVKGGATVKLTISSAYKSGSTTIGVNNSCVCAASDVTGLDASSWLSFPEYFQKATGSGDYEADSYNANFAGSSAKKSETLKVSYAMPDSAQPGTVKSIYFKSGNGGYMAPGTITEWVYEWTNLSITGAKTKTYTGKGLTQDLTVKIGGKKLASNSYKVTYKNNKNVGKATATVKVTKGTYKGLSKSVTFKIIPKGTKIADIDGISEGFTVSWNKQSAQTSGYQLRYSTSSNMSGAKTVSVKSAKKTSTKVAKLKEKTKYYVQIRTYKAVGKTKYYSSWSSVKAVKTDKKAISAKEKYTPKNKLTITSVTPGEAGTNKLTVKYSKAKKWYRYTTSNEKPHSGYQLQVSTNKKFTNVVSTITDIKNQSNCTKTVKSLKGGTTYYVRVRQFNVYRGAQYNGPWSAVKSATVPSKYQPTEKLKFKYVNSLYKGCYVELYPASKWYSGTGSNNIPSSYYELKISANKSFKGSSTCVYTVRSQYAPKFFINALGAGKTYYVKVRQVNMYKAVDYTGPWSTVRSFTTRSQEAAG